MRGQVGAFNVEMFGVRQTVWFQHSPVDEQQLMSGRCQVLDDRPTDESSPAEDYYFQTGLIEVGLRSTITSIKPQSFASSGFMKKSRSIALSTSSSGRPVCLE
jgi:hypothetical protein